MLKLPPLSLYVHIPWCVKKCPYCDFNSHSIDSLESRGAVGSKAKIIASSATPSSTKSSSRKSDSRKSKEAESNIPEAEYTQALISDLSSDFDYVQGRELHSIFFGGGTPSLFSAKAIGEILDAAEHFIGFSSDIEITLEANPGTADSGHFEGYRKAGVNRLSIGIQSFNDEHLKTLGRIHSGDQARRAVSLARQAGFDNINIDLMHGLPGQTLAQAAVDLPTAIALGATHLSWYQLTIEPNTEFYSAPPTLPRDDILAEIQSYGQALLEQEGFKQYEVSAYAQAGKESRHNTNYWQFGDYLGIGAGAHGKITMAEEQHIVRTRKTRRPEGYLAREDNYLVETRLLNNEELPLEFMMNALRLNQGVPQHYFAERSGMDFGNIVEAWRKLESQGLVEALPQNRNQNFKVTDKGHYFLDTILAEF